MLKHLIILSALTGVASLIAIPMTNYAFLYGSWMAAYWIHFALLELALLIIYPITVMELSS